LIIVKKDRITRIDCRKLFERAGLNMVKPNMLKSQPPMVSAGRPPTPAKQGPVERRRAEATAQSTALFIAQMTAELAQLAHFGRLGLLTYLLDMARLEAEFHCRRAGPQERAFHG
jgi:hypothetical protein